jgi:hypothetical protein
VWPPFDGKAAAIARRKVEGLTADEKLLEQLAERCWQEAARRWAMLCGAAAAAG